MTERSTAVDMDARDPLAAFHDRFLIADPNTLYLDGNSLGRLPRATVDHIAELLSTEWGSGLIRNWDRWIELPASVGDLIGTELLGSRPGEVLVCDSTSVNLYKLASAALDDARGTRDVIVTDDQNFPSDRYVLEGLAQARDIELRVVSCDPVEGPTLADIEPAIDEHVALVSLSHVGYRSGAIADVEAITDAAHDAEALVLWDLSHSVGAVPIDLEAWDVDLAVGCTYKYLNGGPGSPAFLYVRSELQDRLRQPIWGWLGRSDPFGFEPGYEAAPGIARFQVGTPVVTGLACVQVGAALIAEARVDALRAKSVLMTEMMVGLFDEWLAPLGFKLASPREPDRRGSHVSFAHPEAWRICRALIERCGVIPDFRAPDVVRLGVAPIYTRFVDAWDAMDRMRSVVERGVHLEMPRERGRVT